MSQLRIHLRDRNPSICYAWEEEFSGLNAIDISHGDIFGVTADAIVSPANSFGFMDGGIDYVYSKRFGWHLQDKLQDVIRSRFDGELPVGLAVLVETGDTDIPFMVSAPTMRVPQNVAQTANAYLAFRAALHVVSRHNLSSERQIKSVLCPGLATAIGEMPASVCAKQMRRAYDQWRAGSDVFPTSVMAAKREHNRITREE